MKQNSSSRKLNEQAREVLAHILLFEVSDPRLDMVTITGCEVSFDRSMCNVYYTVDPSRYEDAAAGRLWPHSFAHGTRLALASDS